MPGARRIGLLLLIGLLGFTACACWNSVKPLPAGTHLSTLPARLAESQVDFIDDELHRGAVVARQLDAIGRAVQCIVLDQSPVPDDLAARLLLRKRQRPNIKIVLVTDPADEAYGGTPARTLSALEAAGVIVARVRLERMRDSNPIYSAFWRLAVSWWTEPFDEAHGTPTFLADLRRRNGKADRRHLFVADDGAGGWLSIVATSTSSQRGPPRAGSGFEIRGHLARDILAGEMRIAAWSSDDDRLPATAPGESRGVGSVDARFLTEGAILTALREAIAIAGKGDSICVVVNFFDERQLLDAVLRAAARGASVKLLLGFSSPDTQAAAGELMREAAGNIEIRWQPGAADGLVRLALIRRGGDMWITSGSAEFARAGLHDANLEADVELHMPARAAPARAAGDLFARRWSLGSAYANHADASENTYRRYRIGDFTGLSMF